MKTILPCFLLFCLPFVSAFVTQQKRSYMLSATTRVLEVTRRHKQDMTTSGNKPNDDNSDDVSTTTSVRSLLLHQNKAHCHVDDATLKAIGHKLRLQVYDVDTGVYGWESNDPDYGIETIRSFFHLHDGDDLIGLELTELAHATTTADHRGLVLVSAVHGEAKLKPVHVGDVLVGVFCGEHFKQSTTGLDYQGTVHVLQRAKHYARSVGGSTLSLEFNRLVKRVPVTVLVQNGNNAGDGITELQAKAGDNLRLILMHHNLTKQLYEANVHRIDQPRLTGNCGGEGVCGTCLVKVLQGMEHLNPIGPQESSILQGRPDSWRAACKTVVGADNQPDTTLRIQLHPQTVQQDTKRTLHP